MGSICLLSKKQGKVMKIETTYFGEFSVNSHHDAIGKISLTDESSKIELTLRGNTSQTENKDVIYADLDRLKKATCVNCIVTNTVITNNASGENSHSVTLFPHHVIIGDEYIDPKSNCIDSFSFYTQDTKDLFRDNKDFGKVYPDEDIINFLKSHYGKKIELCDFPHIFFHSGRENIIECKTLSGNFRVFNNTTINGLGHNGDFLNNKVKIEFTFNSPVSFDSYLKALLSHLRFLNILTGREQHLGDSEIHIKTKNSPIDKRFTVLSSYQKKTENESKDNYISNSSPINPITKKNEFIEIYKTWMFKEAELLISRIRYNSSFSKQHFYDADRLVAAANIFDTLPKSCKPTKKSLNEHVASAKEKSKEIFKALPDSIEKNIVLGTLGRLESPTLTDIILHRSNLILEKCKTLFPELDLAIKVAVKVRNYFVHGTFNYQPQIIERHALFLTDVLEFIFVASDLIECGWDIESWSKEHYSLGHPFNNLRYNFKDNIEALKNDLN